MEKKVWGFLRETSEQARRVGLDRDTGIPRTGLDEYLSFIFPQINDWIHNEEFGYVNGKRIRKKPDYRSEKLKMIVEFDGIDHYKSPYNIRKDETNTLFYMEQGYKVVRIPYFIQLSNDAVFKLFGITINEQLFDESIPSLGPKGRNTPAYLSKAGIERMAKEFREFPNQYLTNINYLKSFTKEDQFFIEYELLEEEYSLLDSK